MGEPKEDWKAALRSAPDPDPAVVRGFTARLLVNLETVKSMLGLEMRRTRDMLERHGDGVEVARLLLDDYFHEPSTGFLDLKSAGQLELSIEASMIDPEFTGLFLPVEVEWATRRLREHGFRPPRRSRGRRST